jgi:hypothetical protein
MGRSGKILVTQSSTQLDHSVTPPHSHTLQQTTCCSRGNHKEENYATWLTITFITCCICGVFNGVMLQSFSLAVVDAV